MPRQKRAYGYGNTSGKPPAPAAPRGQRRFVRVPGIAALQHPQSYIDREPGEAYGFPAGAAPIGATPFFTVAQQRADEAKAAEIAGIEPPRGLLAAEVAQRAGDANFLVLPQAGQMAPFAPPPAPPQDEPPAPGCLGCLGRGRVMRRVQPLSSADYWGNSRMQLSGNPLRPHQHFSSVYSPEAVETQFR